MINKPSFIRTQYLQQLLSSLNSNEIKIITGSRCVGKTHLIKDFIRSLASVGINRNQILYIDFELPIFSEMSCSELLAYLHDIDYPDKICYYFLDEVQQVAHWEYIIRELFLTQNCDIFLIGSNSSVFSPELFADECIPFREIKIYPLSFREYLIFKDYQFNINKINALSSDYTPPLPLEDTKNLETLFHDYIYCGGIPLLANNTISTSFSSLIFDGLYSTIVLKDILERRKQMGQHSVLDTFLLRKLIIYLSKYIGHGLSATSVSKNLLESYTLTSTANQHKPSTHTILAYQQFLCEAYLFYDIAFYDINRNILLKSPKKYYIANVGMLHHLFDCRSISGSVVLENIVYFELLRRNYIVHCGKVGSEYIDFIARREDQTKYVQLVHSIDTPSTINKKIKTLKAAKVKGDKIVITMNPANLKNLQGNISVVSAFDFLLGSELHI